MPIRLPRLRPLANKLRWRRPRPGDKWHLNEVFMQIQGELHNLWRPVDQDGVALDILVQSRRDAVAAKRFFKRWLKALQYVPRVLVTDKLRNVSTTLRQFFAYFRLTVGPRLHPRAFSSATPSDDGGDLSLRTGDRLQGLAIGDVSPKRSAMMYPASHFQPGLDHDRLS